MGREGAYVIAIMMEGISVEGKDAIRLVKYDLDESGFTRLWEKERQKADKVAKARY